MTMTSREERREVAERLRDEAGGFRRLEKEWGHEPAIDLGDVPAVFQDVAHFAGLDGTVRTCVLFDRLADLIDPTCHKVIPSEIEGYVFCSKCGAEIGEYGVPNYCPNCGARVVPSAAKAYAKPRTLDVERPAPSCERGR